MSLNITIRTYEDLRTLERASKFHNGRLNIDKIDMSMIALDTPPQGGVYDLEFANCESLILPD